MNSNPRSRANRTVSAVPRAVLLGLLSCATVVALRAQTAQPTPPADEDETIVLSPFVVDATQDRGYQATNTLAGSRINTSLKDLAASITEITSVFLKDVSAVDINDVLTYQAGAESTLNYTNAPASGIGGFSDVNASNPNTANRIRGLNAATLTRDYFISIGANIGFDAYNVDRISINRGPNSILFGLGDPSGVVNYQPKIAMLAKHANSVSFRYGSNDDKRATVDFNYVLLPKKLALRVEGLWADRGFEQKPAYWRDSRISVNGTYRPWDATTFHAGYEHVRQRTHIPNSITPLDEVTTWIAQGRPTWDPSTQLWSERPTNFNGTTGGGFIGATNPDGSLAYTFQEAAGQAQFASFYQPQTPGVAIFNTIGLSNDKYVDLHGMNLNSGFNHNDMDTITLTWDQRITPDLFLNVAYLHEELDSFGRAGTRTNQYGIFVDMNKTLPNGGANPHFGETYLPQRSLDGQFSGTTENEALRATLTYNLDLTRQSNWVRWLGRHAFTGFGEHRLTESAFNGYNGTRDGTPSYLNPADRINSESWQLTRFHYLGGTPDSQAKYAPVPPQYNVSGVPNSYWNGTSWATDTYSDFFALKRRDLTSNVIKSMAAVWQGYFLDNRIVGTAGIRHDENSSASVASTQVDPTTGFLKVNDAYGAPNVVSGNTKTYGVVVHPVKWVSLFYNRSENFIPRAGDVNIFGEIIAPPSGKGKDYGVGVDLIEGKLSVRVNWYEVSSNNARISNSGPDIEAQWELPWFDQVVIPKLAAKYGLTHTSFFSPITWGDNRIEETADQVSKGTEVEVVYNPTRNWRILANVSKGKAAQSNIAPALSRWVKEILPTWTSQPWFTGPETYDAGWGVDGNLQTYFTSFNTARNLATYKANEGQTVQELRKWHANLISNYEFDTGTLKGVNFGGAVRWESAAAIGYPAIVSNGLLTGLDLAHPYNDDEQWNLDLWAGYTRKIFHDKYEWNVQLNVRNVTGDNDLQPILANSDGTPAQFRIRFGPTWYLTTTLNF